MTSYSNTNLILALAHELSVALEMTYDKHELVALWPEALDALREAKTLLEADKLSPPAALINVLRSADRLQGE